MTSVPTTEPPAWHHLPVNPYNSHAWFVGEPSIGEGCWIGAFTVLDASGGLTIGNNCDISAGVQIYTHSTVRRVLTNGAAPIDRASTSIGRNVHLGAGAVVLMGCTIGDHCVIAAGAVVPQHTHVPPWSVAAGIPAVVKVGAARRLTAEPETIDD